MGLIVERSINGVGFINEVLSIGTARPCFMTVHISSNIQDQVVIQSGPAGSDHMHLTARPKVTGGPTVELGGPVRGPFVSINWSGNADFKSGLFRVYDEPQAPFGRVWLESWTELAIAPAATGADHVVNQWGSWIEHVGFLEFGNQNRTSNFDFEAQTLGGAKILTLPGTLGQANLLEIPAPCDSVTMSVTNNGAGNLDWSVAVYGRLV